MKNKKRNGIVVALFIICILFCAGCAKQNSSFQPTAAYSYDDSQELNRAARSGEKSKQDQGNRDAIAKVLENAASQKIKRTDAEKEKNRKKETDQKQSESPVSIEEQTTVDEAANQEVNSENAKERRQNNNSRIKDPNNDRSNHTGQVVNNQINTNKEDKTGRGDKAENKSDSKGEKSGKGSNGKPKENKDGEPENKKMEQQEEEEIASKPDPEKLVSLSCDGELGKYIWGEEVNLSNLSVKAIFEDGHEEEITDYSVNMNYPELYDPGVYAYEDHRSMIRAIDCYTPGVYNATIEYNGITAEVPYTLIILYVNLEVYHYSNCHDPEGHHAEYYKPDCFEIGHYICDEEECRALEPNGEISKYSGEGYTFDLPLLYDYTLTEEDIWNYSYFSSLDLGQYYFQGFPAVYDKNSAVPIGNGYKYDSLGTFVSILAPDYKEFRGNKPVYINGLAPVEVE